MKFGHLLWKISPQAAELWWHIFSKTSLWWRFNVLNAIYFLLLAWHTLTGKLMLVQSEKTTSNGGYKYLTLTLSKRPLSSHHTYEDL